MDMDFSFFELKIKQAHWGKIKTSEEISVLIFTLEIIFDRLIKGFPLLSKFICAATSLKVKMATN